MSSINLFLCRSLLLHKHSVCIVVLVLLKLLNCIIQVQVWVCGWLHNASNIELTLANRLHGDLQVSFMVDLFTYPYPSLKEMLVVPDISTYTPYKLSLGCTFIHAASSNDFQSRVHLPTFKLSPPWATLTYPSLGTSQFHIVAARGLTLS